MNNLRAIRIVISDAKQSDWSKDKHGAMPVKQVQVIAEVSVAVQDGRDGYCISDVRSQVEGDIDAKETIDVFRQKADSAAAHLYMALHSFNVNALMMFAYYNKAREELKL